MNNNHFDINDYVVLEALLKNRDNHVIIETQEEHDKRIAKEKADRRYKIRFHAGWIIFAVVLCIMIFALAYTGFAN